MCEARGRVGYVTLLALVLTLFPSQARGNATRAHLHCTSQDIFAVGGSDYDIRKKESQGQDLQSFQGQGFSPGFPHDQHGGSGLWSLDSWGDGEWIDIAFKQKLGKEWTLEATTTTTTITYFHLLRCK